MMNTQTDTVSLNRNTLCVALVKHTLLLKSGLTPFEAQCAIFSPAVERALEASTPREQENFGLYMHYQVEQYLAAREAVANNVISISDFIAKKNQQQQALTSIKPSTPHICTYANDELMYASL